MSHMANHFGYTSPMLCSHISFCKAPPGRWGCAFALAALLAVLAAPVHAQPERSGNTFYGKFGAGIADYTGDFPAQNASHPLDLQEFTRGSGVPVVVAGEVGYRFSPAWSLALGVQGGNYPIVGYGGGPSGITDSYRYTPHLLGRYTFGTPGQRIAPYVDGGISATFGGDTPPTSLGIGPSLGGGVDILLGRRLSFYVESRFHASLPDDAIDGADRANGAFDTVGQLLGFGLTINLSPSTPTPPAVRSLDGPASVEPGTAVTFTASVNEEAAARPLSYEWEWGDGATANGSTATHRYDQPGTYTVVFRARNDAGTAQKTMTVRVRRSSEDSDLSTAAQIASLTATPNPVATGTPVQFNSAVAGDSAPTYEWRFGDGATATGSAPTHTYEQPGRYTARLTVSNDAGSDARTIEVRVARRAGQDRARQWRIVVASMRRQEGAETLADRYREQLPTADMPVEIVAAETEQGLRYRVVVGTFAAADAARQAIEAHEDVLPAEAWPLQPRR